MQAVEAMNDAVETENEVFDKIYWRLTLGEISDSRSQVIERNEDNIDDRVRKEADSVVPAVEYRVHDAIYPVMDCVVIRRVEMTVR